MHWWITVDNWVSVSGSESSILGIILIRLLLGSSITVLRWSMYLVMVMLVDSSDGLLKRFLISVDSRKFPACFTHSFFPGVKRVSFGGT